MTSCVLEQALWVLATLLNEARRLGRKALGGGLAVGKTSSYSLAFQTKLMWTHTDGQSRRVCVRICHKALNETVREVFRCGKEL